MTNRFLAAAVLSLALPGGLAAAPAARAGDTTSHGGVVLGGSATVLIGGRPAARAGNLASCPLSSGPTPHVGGPIVTGAATVLIGGAPAARAGDLVVETGATSVLATGQPTVLIGSSASR